MAPFKAKGPKPEWQIVYEELLEKADFGDIVSFSSLDRVLGRDFKVSRGPVYKATRYLGEQRKRWLAPVKGVGYRVIEANEHMLQANMHKKRAKKQLGVMIKVGNATEITRLTNEELARFDSQRKVNAVLFMVAIHHEDRIKRIEQVLEREGLMTP